MKSRIRFVSGFFFSITQTFLPLLFPFLVKCLFLPVGYERLGYARILVPGAYGWWVGGSKGCSFMAGDGGSLTNTKKDERCIVAWTYGVLIQEIEGDVFLSSTIIRAMLVGLLYVKFEFEDC